MPPLGARLGSGSRRLLLVPRVSSSPASVGDSSRSVISSSTKMRWSRLISSLVLGGAQVERAAEAGDFWLEGWARRSCSRGPRADDGETALRARGLTIPVTGRPPAGARCRWGAECGHAVLGRRAGNDRRAKAKSCAPNAPSQAVGESSRLRRGFTPHERRWSGVGISQAPGLRVIMRASRHDARDGDRWWATRRDLRFAPFETQKFPRGRGGVGGLRSRERTRWASVTRPRGMI